MRIALIGGASLCALVIGCGVYADSLRMMIGGGIAGVATPVAIPANLEMPQIIGEDFPTSPATTVTLTADVGQWTNTPTGFTHNWHDLSGNVLGTGTSITLPTVGVNSAIGTVVEDDVTAINAGGSSTKTSHWFGPIEASAPVAPVAYELQNPAPTSIPLPVSPANFLQKGHAVFPGCDIPPPVPNLTPSNVFYFDSINGTTQAAQTAAGVPTASQGHLGHAFKDLNAFFDNTNVAGYSGPLFGFGNVIPPGSTVYVEPGNAANPVGSLVSGAPQWSTSDGTATGTPVFTWVMADPAAASKPVIVTDAGNNGAIVLNNGARGILFRNLRVEPAVTDPNEPAISISANSAAAPAKDLFFEGMRVSAWGGHSDDPWAQSVYPNVGGHSDGTVLTATPAIPAGGFQDGLVATVTMAKGATTFSGASSSLVGRYIWSNGYYRDTIDSIIGGSSGIPNGTKIVSVSASGVATIGACDPVADAATGCPATPIPGCDPFVTFRGVNFGGCPAGSTPAWNGATRAINGERLMTTEQMKVTPAGSFANNDWGTAFSAGFVAAGGMAQGASTVPNMPVGISCISLKDSWFRDLRNAIQFGGASNSVSYNNRTKYTSADATDIYSDHRVWSIHNSSSDPTEIWDHQDAIQFADTSGTSAQVLYGDAAIENELIQNVATDNYFPRSWEGIEVTDNTFWGLYVADNVVYANTNGIGITGSYDVVAHNDMFGSALTVGHDAKVTLTGPVGTLMANNIANGVGRSAANFANACDPVAGDLDTVLTNISIPFIPVTGVASNTVCQAGGGGTISAGGFPGVYQGLEAWTATDWRTGQTGVSPLFAQYDPLSAPVAPAPGAGLWTQISTFTCTQLSNTPFSCSAGGMGAINTRPNASFAGTTTPILGTFSVAQFLPQTGSIGDAYVVTSTDFCAGQPNACGPNGTSLPPGLYVRTTASGTFTQWTIGPYNPGIIGTGTNLGAQQPIANHDGNAWSSPPNVGAY